MIEWARIRELRDEIGADDFREIAVMFLEEAEEVVGRLGRDGQSQRVADDLHFLKGAALNLGLQDFADSCQRGERAVATGVDADLASIVSGFQVTRSAFMAGLEEVLAGRTPT